jgi:hypothetical protein
MRAFLSVAELAYAAGIIDGEGSIGLAKTRRRGQAAPNWNVRLEVASTDWRLLSWLRNTFDLGAIGNVHSRAGWRPCGRWTVHKRAAGEVIQAVRPYLVIKAEQADIALAFRASIEAKRSSLRLTLGQQLERDELRDRLRTLNQRGRGGDAKGSKSA